MVDSQQDDIRLHGYDEWVIYFSEALALTDKIFQRSAL